MPRRQLNEPIITVKLQRGLADRRRLPMEHVLKVLEEFRHMINEVGQEVEQELGLERGSTNFGLELLANSRGKVFRGGSVTAQIAITSNAQNGLLAVQKVLETVNTLRHRRTSTRVNGSGELDHRILRRLNRIADIQETDKTEMQIAITRPAFGDSKSKREKATFNQVAIDRIRSLQEPIFTEDGLNVYGKLYELRDRSMGEETTKSFWGELRRENGEVWRLQFRAEDASKIASLFTQQISVIGKAVYYRAQNPKLVVETIAIDEERDYEKAFDELYGCNREAYGNTDLKTLLKRMHGDE